MYQRTALGNIHAPKLHTRNSDLHATLSADADCVLSRRTNGLHHTDAYFKLRRGSDVADVERVEQYGDYVYHSRCAVVHRPVGCDRRKWRVGDRQPHFVRRIRQLMRERATHLHQRLTERIVYECFVYATDPNYANKFGFVSESHGLNPAGK